MHVISTWSSPNTVYFSAKLSWDTLVIAKSSRLDVIHLSPERLLHKCGLELSGTVTSLNTFNDTWRIFVTTDNPVPGAFLIDYHDNPPRLTLNYSLSLYSRSSRPSEFFQGAVVHPNARLAVSSAYSGTVKVLSLDETKKSFDSRIPELELLSMCFLSSTITSSPVLALLHIDFKLRYHILAREVDLTNQELSIEPSQILPPAFVQDGASLLIPVPGSSDLLGGILVLGGGVVQFFECSSPSIRKQRRKDRQSPENKRKRTRGSTEDESTAIRAILPFHEVVAHSLIDDDGHRILIADAYGRLVLLALLADGESTSISVIRCLQLGEVSSPSSLTYLNDGVFYVGSHFGDSQLSKLLQLPETHEDGRQSRVRILEVFKNIAPIHDAVVTHTDGSSQVATCSGGYNSGSIRIVRKGADFKEVALVERMPHVTSIWPLRFMSEDKYDRFLLLSTLYDTQLIDLGEGILMEELTPGQFSDLVRDKPTIAAGNLTGQTGSGSAFVQITSDAVIVIDLGSGFEMARWPPSPKDAHPDARRRENVRITIAAVNPTQILVALRGGEVVYLLWEEDDEGCKLVEAVSRTFLDANNKPREFCALSTNPIWSGFPNESRVAVAAFWGSNEVILLKLPSLKTFNDPRPEQDKHEVHLPRSVLLHTFGDTAPFLLVGLANGLLITYELDPRTFEMKARRTISLGSMPLRLTPSRHGADKHVVFVSGSRPAVVFLENGRLQYSPIVLKNVNCASMLNSKAYPNSLILAGFDNLVIGQLLELHKLHIRSVHLGLDNPRRICYDPDSKTFGIITIRKTPPPVDLPSSLPSSSSFRILNELTFETLVQFPMNELEEATCIGSLKLSSAGREARHFVIGSENLARSDTTPVLEQGRIRVYRVISEHDIELVASLAVSGCVSSLASIDGKIVACIGSAVIVYKLTQEERQETLTLAELAKWDRGYSLVNVRTWDDKVITADALRSLDVLRWGTDDGKLTLVARDHSSLWPIAVEVLDSSSVIVAEGDGNLFSYRLDGNTLERAGSYHLGENVSEFRRGTIISTEQRSSVKPVLIFFTSNGRIGIISEVKSDVALLLTALERNLGDLPLGPVAVPVPLDPGKEPNSKSRHAMWRSVKSPRTGPAGEGEAVGFIDGDFVERFLNLTVEDAKRVLEGTNASKRIRHTYEAVTQTLEQLQLVH